MCNGMQRKAGVPRGYDEDQLKEGPIEEAELVDAALSAISALPKTLRF